jgi:hypothetical protein
VKAKRSTSERSEMGIRRPGTKGYEEVEGVNIPTVKSGAPSQHVNSALASPEFELASVSVVPDGKKTFRLASAITSCCLTSHRYIFRYFYGCAGGERIGLWMVSGEALALRRSLLDERLDGDDDSLGAWTSVAL